MSQFNTSGTFSISGIGLPYVPGTLISSSVANQLNTDLATGLSTCILKDGTQVVTADIPFNFHKLTEVNIGSASTDAANIANIQASTGTLLTVTGTNTLIGTATPAITAYISGMTLRFFSAAANTGAVTLNVNGLGAKNVYKDGLVPLVAGDIAAASNLITVVYDGTQFVLQKPFAFTSLSATSFSVGSVTSTSIITGSINSTTSVTTDLTTNTFVTNNAKETATISNTASTGTINFDLKAQNLVYYTANATANFTVNFQYTGSTVNAYMTTGQMMTAVFMATQGSTAYYSNAVQVDGTSTGVTVKWQSASTPTAGNVNSIDVYSYTIIKTGNAAYTVLISQIQFA